MPRPILAESQIHPAVREKIANYRTDIVKEVQAAVAANDIVVVGMRMNPFPRRARKALDAYNEHVEKHGVFSDGLRSF